MKKELLNRSYRYVDNLQIENLNGSDFLGNNSFYQEKINQLFEEINLLKKKLEGYEKGDKINKNTINILDSIYEEPEDIINNLKKEIENLNKVISEKEEALNQSLICINTHKNLHNEGNKKIKELENEINNLTNRIIDYREKERINNQQIINLNKSLGNLNEGNKKNSLS